MQYNYVFYEWVIKKIYKPTKFYTLIFEGIKERFLFGQFWISVSKMSKLIALSACDQQRALEPQPGHLKRYRRILKYTSGFNRKLRSD